MGCWWCRGAVQRSRGSLRDWEGEGLSTSIVSYEEELRRVRLESELLMTSLSEYKFDVRNL